MLYSIILEIRLIAVVSTLLSLIKRGGDYDNNLAAYQISLLDFTLFDDNVEFLMQMVRHLLDFTGYSESETMDLLKEVYED